jgi:hypothetical protein
MPAPSPSLVVLSCSATKFDITGQVPAIHLYDGPIYRILRSHLRTNGWPKNLSVGVLSAKYGLIGGLATIRSYEQRMTPRRAEFLRCGVSETLAEFAQGQKEVHFVLGKDYMRAVDSANLEAETSVKQAEGPIGRKLEHFSRLLSAFPSSVAAVTNLPEHTRRPLYFLPDWDDFLDRDFDFESDTFSHKEKAERRQVHSIELLRPRRICDGVLISLAQHFGSKGLLKRLPMADPLLLRPQSVRDHFGLEADQWAFGDCGAFSYVNEPQPTISIEQAVAVYDLYGFDLGASVDHIPALEIVGRSGKRRKLSDGERRERVRLTRDNADSFLRLHRERKCSFLPVGVIQGMDAKGYGKDILPYLEMGYRHIALGGLVPKSDEEIRSIVSTVEKVLSSVRSRPWLHLLGVFRPKLQDVFRESGVNSFDSATYFRKAWLRSDQNYLASNGDWYSAVRVPPSRDPRILKRLRESGMARSTIKRLERTALGALRSYDRNELSLKTCLRRVLRYDKLLSRGEKDIECLAARYRRTLEDRPWELCSCKVCEQIGIEVAIFRGYNRNKRRGAHNTLQLFGQLS